jgi:hypothetical protein
MVRSGQKGVSRLATRSPGRVFPRGSFHKHLIHVSYFPITTIIVFSILRTTSILGPHELSKFRVFYIRFHPA